ncbi:MAG: putative glycosyltransferase [Clostridiaceae bacterium]|jgi:GT2 family glycosyltransferase|nr:putative glycosyltransferase [Clostridiaceae bacterium]
MKISIIIVSYNTKQLLADCINSIEKNLYNFSYEIVVVDNNSADGSADMLKAEYSHVKLIANNYNAGFAKANNQGLELCSGDYILLLNSDTIVLKDAISTLVGFMDSHSHTAICGPKLLNSDMTLQLPCRRGFPRLINSVSYFSGISRIFPKSRIFGSYLMTYMDSGINHEVDAVSGACLLIRRKVLSQIGGLLDEAFFMHFEDIDLCYRAKKSGYKVYYIHNSEVIHLKGQSSILRSSGVSRNFFDSALLYFKKNYRKENLAAYLLMTGLIRIMKKVSLIAGSFKLRDS